MLASLAAGGMLLRGGRFQSTHPSLPKIRKYSCFVYSTMVLVLVLLSFARHITINFDLGMAPPLKDLIWDLQAAGHIFAFYLASVRAFQSQFYVAWQEYREKYAIASGIINRTVNVCTGILWVIVFVLSVSTGLMMYQDYHIYGCVIFKAIFLVIDIYLIFSWTASSVYLFLICKLLADEFQLLDDEMRRLYTDDRKAFYKTVGDYRSRHWELSQLAQTADNIFCLHLGLSIIGSTIVSCFGLYILIWKADTFATTQQIVISAIWLCTDILKMTIDCKSGMHLNRKVDS